MDATGSESQRISHFEVLMKIGRGGMGEVFLAQDTSLDRPVALKFLPESLQEDETARKRFLREAKSAAALDHPYICHIHEVGEEDGRPFISMEYIEGTTLREKLEEGRLPLKEALQVATEVAEALEVAHAHGIVHRDLKPANIMLTLQGHAKVMDFGLAKRLLPSGAPESEEQTITAELTRRGTMLGTLAYMSPEQLRGESVDARSDVFAFGVVLYEMLTGGHPFLKAERMETASAILRDEPAPLSDHVPDIPEALENAVQKALAKKAGNRYESVRDLRLILGSLITGEVPLFPARRRLTRRRAVSLIGVAAAVALAALVGLDVGGWRSWLARQVTVGGPPRVRSLAVLPLQNVSGDPDQDYLADGMTDALITELGQIQELRVISRISAMRYRGVDTPLDEIARELNVDAVVEGSTQLVGQSAGINVRLIHAASGNQLWSQAYQRVLSDLLLLQGEVAHAIALQVEVAVTPDEEARLAANREIDRESYEAYLRGTYYLNKYTPEDIQRGLDHLEQAIEIDPANALAYAGLAAAYSDFAHMPLPIPDAFPRARAAAQRALSLDDTLAEAHLSMAEVKLYYEWDLPGAEAYFQRALELEPSSARAHMHYGWWLDIVGRMDEVVPEFERAIELDPFYPIYTAWLAWWHWWCAGNYDEAIDIVSRSVDTNPEMGVWYYVAGGAYAEKGMFEEAIAAREKLAELRPWGKGALAVVYAQAGRRDEAQKIAAEMADSTFYWTRAHIHAALGEKDEAFRCLEQAAEKRFLFFPWVRKVPVFRSLQEDPRFEELMRRAGLEP